MAKNTKISTKEKLLNTAVTLFAQEGYHAVSIRQIVGKVGIKESSFYNHYTSKEALLSAIFDSINEEMANDYFPADSVTELIQNQTSEQVLLELLESYIEFWFESAMEQKWLILSMEQFRREDAMEIVLRRHEQNLAYFTRIFWRMINAGNIPVQDPRMLAAEFWHILQSFHQEYALRHVHQNNPDKFYQKMRAQISFFCRQLTV